MQFPGLFIQHTNGHKTIVQCQQEAKTYAEMMIYQKLQGSSLIGEGITLDSMKMGSTAADLQRADELEAGGN
ncbi:hypothetical protein RJT34_22011 [Clitoria ternatea]|uniref:Uncharacterized protein n=1 Tax=Clitoria ternatea TaxID=43366 RepID=A0AAN9IUU5_CLITE